MGQSFELLDDLYWTDGVNCVIEDSCWSHYSEFTENESKSIKKYFLCQDSVVLDLNELDYTLDETASQVISCDALGEGSVQMEVSADNCFGSEQEVFYEIFYDISDFSSKTVDIRQMFNINQPSEWDSHVSPDLIGTVGDDLNLAIKLQNVENVIWMPDDTYFSNIQSRRNSLTIFNDLKVPCLSKLELSLKEDDTHAWADEVSQVITIDCDQIGAQEVSF
jgi:hypothetical protein